jgi:hypothetical protein
VILSDRLPFTSGRPLPRITGPAAICVLSLAGVAAALLLAHWLLPPSLSDGVLRAGIVGGVASGVAILIHQVLRGMWFRGRQMRAATAQTAMARDPRPPVVYFRSFDDDTFSFFDFGSSLEENLASVFRAAGPMVAVGRPNESLPPLGAARWYVGDQEWQEVVTRLLDQAAVVIVRLGITPGVLWEVRAAVRCVAPQRLLIALPPLEASTNGQAKREALYREFRTALDGIFPISLPETIGNAVFVAFDADWAPRLLRDASVKRHAMLPRTAMRAALSSFTDGLKLPQRRFFLEMSPQLVFLALMLGSSNVAIRADNQPAWTPFEPASARFVVNLPGAAQETELASPIADIVIRQAHVRWKPNIYSAAYWNYPSASEPQTPEEREESLDGARDGMIQNVEGKLLHERQLNVEGNPGRDLVIEIPAEKALYKARIFSVGSQAVVVSVTLPADSEYPSKNSSNVQTFFDSLQLKP